MQAQLRYNSTRLNGNGDRQCFVQREIEIACALFWACGAPRTRPRLGGHLGFYQPERLVATFGRESQRERAGLARVHRGHLYRVLLWNHPTINDARVRAGASVVVLAVFSRQITLQAHVFHQVEVRMRVRGHLNGDELGGVQ